MFASTGLAWARPLKLPLGRELQGQLRFGTDVI